MSLILGYDKKVMLLCFAAAGFTIVAGILHITMVPRSLSHNPAEGVLFLVGGILQVFWALPVIKWWGRVWQIVGIIGTAVFVALWFSDRLHVIPDGFEHLGAPPMGEGRPEGNRGGGGIPSGFSIGGIALPIEICQIAFVVIYAVLMKINPKKDKVS